jgi:hypothetical protein
MKQAYSNVIGRGRDNIEVFLSYPHFDDAARSDFSALQRCSAGASEAELLLLSSWATGLAEPDPANGREPRPNPGAALLLVGRWHAVSGQNRPLSAI